MKYNQYPRWNDPRVLETCEYLKSLVQADRHIQRFLKNYFITSLVRIAQNIVFLRNIIPSGGAYLDVGSFGLEPAILEKEKKGVSIKAINNIGYLLGIDSRGICLRDDNDGSEINWTDIGTVDVEKDTFPFEDDTFDVITCFEVLEHLKYNPVPMFREIKRVLRPEGIFALTTPNINSAGSILRILGGTSPQQDPYFHIPVENHLNTGIIHPKEYTINEVSILFNSLGFEILFLESMYTKKPRLKENIISCAISFYFFLSGFIFRNERKKFNPGDGIIAIARKGGDIITELPKGIFEY